MVWNEFLTGTVFPLVTALVVGLVSLLIKRLATKYKLEGLLKHQELIEKLATQGITKAEELAVSYVKTKQPELSSGNKLTVAIEHIMKAMPKVSEQQATDIVHSMLARLSGVGATGDTAIK